MAKTFWTDKRLEALSRASMTLFQGFILVGLLGGVFDKITTIWLKTLFIILTTAFFITGIVFADKLDKEN